MFLGVHTFYLPCFSPNSYKFAKVELFLQNSSTSPIYELLQDPPRVRTFELAVIHKPVVTSSPSTNQRATPACSSAFMYVVQTRSLKINCHL